MDSGSGVRLADLPEDARNAYLLRHAALIRVLETIYRQVQEGVMEADALGMLPGAYTPLFRDSWQFLRGSYSADFRAYFEGRYELAEPEAGTKA